MRNLMCGLWCVGLLAGFALVSAEAQYTNASSVLNGFGGRSTAGAYTHVGAGAQPSSIGTAYEGGPADYGGGQINRAGFLNMFVLVPDLDTNDNGVPDELDPDNDGDGLWDHWEISGEKFSPVTPTDPNVVDSDGDGVSDADERVAGSNPQDAGAAFGIVAFIQSGGDKELSWQARGNHERIYVVRAIDGSYDGTPTTVIWSNTVAGGSAPWYEMDATITDPATDGRFYAVEVIQP